MITMSRDSNNLVLEVKVRIPDAHLIKLSSAIQRALGRESSWWNLGQYIEHIVQAESHPINTILP